MRTMRTRGYFLGSAHLQARQFPEAIAAFDHAIKLNATHASAWFGLSRAYQQSGDTTKAREHLVRFQQITQTKVGTPMSLAYGEQGKYSRVLESAAVVQKVADAIPVRFVSVTEQLGFWGRPMETLGISPASLAPVHVFWTMTAMEIWISSSPIRARRVG